MRQLSNYVIAISVAFAFSGIAWVCIRFSSYDADPKLLRRLRSASSQYEADSIRPFQFVTDASEYFKQAGDLRRIELSQVLREVGTPNLMRIRNGSGELIYRYDTPGES